ncbi:MAG: acyl-CoA dehydrogenase [Methylocystis sp.]|nr:acyl-CoA dehydrogenase [Methylocystis sp.]MCA3583629.1 acyl-CoA dehydrogenase [Methylocystis sp.]MCA3593284.1 acyl-CoA dehydrogenase [Methylocystis sp.]
MTYAAPVKDIAFIMRHVAGLARGQADGLYADLDDATADAILEEAAKFAEQRLAPLNWPGDRAGATLGSGGVKTAPGWKEAYADWAASGWLALPAQEAFGGQGLPILLNSACTEIWNAANLAFALNPLLTMGAIEALTTHGSKELQDRYLAKLISGEWTGTMNLTEPQAGSDLAALRSKAEPAGDGAYRITGQKIYITYGDHDLTENICHLVLARLPGAPAGTRGISLFLVPKVLPDGSRNDVRCHSIEHKLGIHASPTCTMVFGDKGGATGWLIGEENKGLACMFTMMNNARLGVALQGVAIADRAYQQALNYAQDRRQGKAPGATGEGMSPIIEHPDVKRMLVDMHSKTAAARAICYVTAAALDRYHRDTDPARKKAAHEEASLLTPVAKAFSTDMGIEVASTGVQVHGGMGFVEETGAAQHYRDARILAIYEGTNGIQSIDLVMRKLPLAGGETVKASIARYRAAAEAVSRLNDPAFGKAGQRLREAVDCLERATDWMLKTIAASPAEALAGATPYLRLFGLAAGGAYLAEAALAAREAMQAGESDPAHGRRIRDCRFFAENSASIAPGIEHAVVDGAQAVNSAYIDAAE